MYEVIPTFNQLLNIPVMLDPCCSIVTAIDGVYNVFVPFEERIAQQIEQFHLFQ